MHRADSNTQETMKKQLYPSASSKFLPLAEEPTNIFDCNTDVYMYFLCLVCAMYFLCLVCAKMTFDRLSSRKPGRIIVMDSLCVNSFLNCFVIIYVFPCSKSYTHLTIYMHRLLLYYKTGRGSSIGSVFAWHASGPEFDPHVRYILSWRLGHENISTAIFPLC